MSSTEKELRERPLLRICQQTQKISRWFLNKKQQQLVDVSGLGNLAHHAGYHVDRKLITAFAEYWRRETNTAHFTGFEMAPSLRDISYIIGLPVTGRVVTGEPQGRSEVKKMCLEYLGKFPGHNNIKCGLIRLPWLRREFFKVPENPSANAIVYSTRAYLLYLLGATIFSELMPGFVSTRYLPLLEDFEKIREYAWGAAALAHLYRGLSIATRPNAKYFPGSATLLVAWIYEYLPLMRPKKQNASFAAFPVACKWNIGWTSFKNLLTYRKKFDSQQLSDVNWNPYKNIKPSIVPEYCRASDDVYYARMWLVSFNIKEIYVPERYARQFGQVQQMCQDVPQWHRQRPSIRVDWRVEYAKEIEEFELLANTTCMFSSRFQEPHAVVNCQKSFSQDTSSGSHPANDAEAEDFATNSMTARMQRHVQDDAATVWSGKGQLNSDCFETILEGIRKHFSVISTYLERMTLPAEIAESISRLNNLTSDFQRARNFSGPQQTVRKRNVPKRMKHAQGRKHVSRSAKPAALQEHLETRKHSGHQNFDSPPECPAVPDCFSEAQLGTVSFEQEISKGKQSDTSEDLESPVLSDSWTELESPISSDSLESRKRKTQVGKKKHVPIDSSQLRRSARLSTQIRQFKHKSGQGSDPAHPIPL